MYYWGRLNNFPLLTLDQGIFIGRFLLQNMRKPAEKRCPIWLKHYYSVKRQTAEPILVAQSFNKLILSSVETFKRDKIGPS